MTKTTSILPFRKGDEIDDPLTALAREGARRILAEALAAEADAFVARFAEARLEDGRRRVVRHGHGPERAIQTGVDPVPDRRPKVRDRGAGESGGEEGTERIAFSSAILPRWARRTRSLDALLPVLYLRGVSTGDFGEALSALLGRDAPNLSPSMIGRLKADWDADYDHWQRRDLSARRYVYVWADGVYLQARMEPTAECMTASTIFADIAFEWVVAIERERLRPRYREGFGRAPLNLRWQPDLRASSEGGVDGPPSQAHPPDDPHVVRGDAARRAVPGRGLRAPRADHAPAPTPAPRGSLGRGRRVDDAEG